MKVVLDASAIVAAINGETGGDVVTDMLADPDTECYAHAFNLCEVYYHFVCEPLTLFSGVIFRCLSGRLLAT